MKIAGNSSLYREVLGSLLEKGHITQSSSILVGCAGSFDASILEELGFTHVTLSNLAPDQDKLQAELSYPVVSLDVENMQIEAESHDWVIVHAGLHHCANPSNALLEMYRVAKVGIVAIEPIHSTLASLAIKAGVCAQYEVGSVAVKDGQAMGGLRYGGIPNLIYRFDRHMVYQTIQTAHPEYEHEYLLWPRLVVPWWRVFRKFALPEKGQEMVKGLARPFCKIPLIANNIGFAVLKPSDSSGSLQPWLEEDSENGFRMK